METAQICHTCNEVIVFNENEDVKLCPICKKVFINIHNEQTEEDGDIIL